MNLRQLRLLEQMKGRPYPCRIRIKPNVICKYRFLYPSERKNHEENHAESIKANKKTSSRWFEFKLIRKKVRVITNLKIEPVYSGNDQNQSVGQVEPAKGIQKRNVESSQTVSEKRNIPMSGAKVGDKKRKPVKNTIINQTLSEISIPPIRINLITNELYVDKIAAPIIRRVPENTATSFSPVVAATVSNPDPDPDVM